MQNFVEPIGFNSELNPKLWINRDLRKDVRATLLKIAKNFYKFLEVSAEIDDVIITGSQTNFEYTKFSDIDLHIVISFENISCDEPIEELFDAKSKLWKEIHDINIHGIPVELYVQDKDKPLFGSSFSLLKNKWVKTPSFSKKDVHLEQVEKLVLLWTRLINTSTETNNLKICKDLMKLLSKFRKLGLKVTGEFGPHNLTFKSLRNANLIGKLKNKILQLEDQKLSLK